MLRDRRDLLRLAFRFHEGRDKLLAEAHARPSTPLPSPTVATRIAAVSDFAGHQADWEHMVALCRRLGAAEPGAGARWCALDAGGWRLRWERHTEMSTWTFYRSLPAGRVPALDETGFDLVPRDWLGAIPGDILVAAHVVLLRHRPDAPAVGDEEEVACGVGGGVADVFTDFRPGPDGFTRLLLVQPSANRVVAGRLVQQLFEIETYRLMALLAFPLAGLARAELAAIEAQATECAMQVARDSSIEADRALLNRLATLAGEAQALWGRTSLRFSAAQSYYGIVQERIHQMREVPMDGRSTIAEFMERRLAPAMRTCRSVAERQERAIKQVARTTQLLSTRVGVSVEEVNSGLLASMNRRTKLQLQLQQTVEGLSVAALSYYSLGLIGHVAEAAHAWLLALNPRLVTDVATPFVVLGVWLGLHRLHARMKGLASPNIR